MPYNQNKESIIVENTSNKNTGSREGAHQFDMYLKRYHTN